MDESKESGNQKKRWGLLLFWRGVTSESALSKPLRAARVIIFSILAAVLVGLAAVVVNMGWQWHRGTIDSLAFLAAGFLVGFLFGIPKVIQGERKQNSTDLLPYGQKVNTNLEEVSDWLTKIIVGLGLFELKQAPSMIWELSGRLSTSFSDPDKQRAVICAAIIFFSVCGFLLGYLVTRIYVQGVFWHADSGTKPDDQESKKDEEDKIGPTEQSQDSADIDPNGME